MLNSKFPSIVEAVTALIKKEKNLKSHIMDVKQFTVPLPLSIYLPIFIHFLFHLKRARGISKFISTILSLYHSPYGIKRLSKRKLTLKREPIDENLDDLVVSSPGAGKSPATKEHFDVLNKS